MPALVSPCCVFATHAQAGRRAHRETKLYFLPPMPVHRLFAGAPENRPYPSANPLVCLSRKSPFACPIRYPVQPPLKIAGLFFFSCLFLSLPPFFFNFFFQFRSVAADVPHRMRFSRTFNPSRPSVSVNPSVLSPTLRTSSWGSPSKAHYSLWIVRDGWKRDWGRYAAAVAAAPLCASAWVCVVSVCGYRVPSRGETRRANPGRPRVGVIDWPWGRSSGPRANDRGDCCARDCVCV